MTKWAWKLLYYNQGTHNKTYKVRETSLKCYYYYFKRVGL